jgi:hypothetical protein
MYGLLAHAGTQRVNELSMIFAVFGVDGVMADGSR